MKTRQRRSNIYEFLFCVYCIASFVNASFAYLFQIVLGVFAVWLFITRKVSFYIALTLLFYGLVYAFGVLSYDGSLSVGLRSGLRLFYPAFALMVGTEAPKYISRKNIVFTMFALLLLEFSFSVLQYIYVPFRVWSYGIYLKDDSLIILELFKYAYSMRVIGTLSNPNTLCVTAIILWTVIILFIQSVASNRNKQLIVVSSTAMIIVIIILSQSRTALVLFLLIVGLSTLWNIRQKKTMLRTIAALPIIVAVVLAVAGIFQRVIYRQISFSSLNPRIDIWSSRIASCDIWYEYIFGIGFQRARDLGFFDNSFLRLFVSSGLVGLLVYIALFVIMYKCALSTHDLCSKKTAVFLLIIWTSAAIVMDLQEIFQPTFILCIVLGYCLSKCESQIVAPKYTNAATMTKIG